MKYRILTNDDPGKLETEVNALLKQGWETLGGIATAQYDYSWGQALIHRTKSE